MVARLLQGILLELKDKVPFVLGVVDADGNVISCTELKYIGDKVATAAEFFASGAEDGRMDNYTFCRLKGFDSSDYAVFAGESSEAADTICKVTAVAITNSKSLYDEKHDKSAFVKRIILDNILPGDIYIKSREMNFTGAQLRAVYLISFTPGRDMEVTEILQGLFPDRQSDFVITINEREVAVVKSFESVDNDEVIKLGKKIDKTLKNVMEGCCVIGIGSVTSQLKDLARSFKEAQISVELGRVFEEDVTLLNFESLGIGRLIYQLPTTLCEMFLSEVFKKGSIESLDEETLFTIYKFFENNLNVSVTARKLFVHRNTLVYRLEKIKKLTGLDLREFDNAIVLKVALMVKKYLKSRDRFI